MAQVIGAVGVALPEPVTLYPVTIGNLPSVAGTNRLTLPPGGDVLIPPGRFLVSPGLVSQIQIADPVPSTSTLQGVWLPYSAATTNEAIFVESDGTNYRVINPTGFPIGAVVTISGGGYTTVPTVTATPGGSTWVAIVGGGVSAISCATAGSGTGYLVPPIINIGVPPSPGVQATAVCTISGGAIATITMVNQGAGYTSVPSVVASPQPSDTNYFPPTGTSTNAIKNASLTAQTSFGGCITAVLMTNEGNNQLSGSPALTFSTGAAAATAILAQSITNITVTTGGSGYSAGVGITTIGGSIAAQTSGIAASTNAGPVLSTGLLVPRQAQISAVIGSGTGVQVGTIVDPGLFTAVPTAFALPNLTTVASASGTGAAAVFSVTMGGVNDTVLIQPL